MSSKNQVANGLAHALLAGAPGSDLAHRGCVDALGRNWRWLDPIITRLQKKFAADWNESSREAMAVDIAGDEAFGQAFHSPYPPRILRTPLIAACARPLPAALAESILPRLDTPLDLAEWLGLNLRQLDAYGARGHWRNRSSASSAHHYQYRWVPKRKGGHRLLESPKSGLKRVQRRILRRLLDQVLPHAAAHGFRVGYSVLDNARMHVGNEVVLHMDLKDFFLSVRRGRVRATFITMGYSRTVAELLAGLCCTQTPADLFNKSESPRLSWQDKQPFLIAHLPQGSPASPALANLCAFRLDLRLAAATEHLGAVYTRYADDLVFSGGKEFAKSLQRFPAFVGAIALEEGFAVNHRKTRIMRASQRQLVTGVVVNEKPNIQRNVFDALKATLHNCVRFGPGTQNRNNHPDFRAHLVGRVAQMGQINAQRGVKLKQVFDQIDWSNVS